MLVRAISRRLIVGLISCLGMLRVDRVCSYHRRGVNWSGHGKTQEEEYELEGVHVGWAGCGI